MSITDGGFTCDSEALALPEQKNTQVARNYRVQVSNTIDFSNLLENVTVDQTTYTAYSRTYPDGPIYWRVQALDSSGNPLTFSVEVRMLSKVSPAPTARRHRWAAQIVTGVPVFSWESRPYARALRHRDLQEPQPAGRDSVARQPSLQRAPPLSPRSLPT